jgi:tetratricopeptide repeat protein 21B
MAKIEASRNATNAANRSLEQALSYDFHIRSIALFRLVRCTILNQQGNYEDAIKEMEDLIQLPEIRSTSALGVYTNPRAAEEDVDILGPRRGRQGEFKGEEPPLMMNSSYADSFRLTDDDRVGAFVTLSQLYGKLRRTKEANKILSEAKVVFSGTPQEVVVLVAASQLAVEKNDYDSAIRMLDKIPDDSLTFVRAQLIKADILLHHSRDHEAYAQCFHLLVEREKTAKHYSLLGEAYLKILNPERAVDAFEAARKLDPNNARLRARIGRALVATHEYHRAIDFYEHAILDAKSQNITMGSIGPPGSSGATVSGISSEAVTLSHDLAKLFMKLDRGEAGIRVLSKVIHETHRDVTDMRQDVATLLLLAEVQGAVDHAKSDSLSSLRKAYDLQKDILSQIRAGIVLSSAGATAERERIILSDICERNATAQATLQKGDDRDRSPGEDMYREAIQHNPHNTKAMLGLAQILRDRGDIEGCQAQANKVILADPSNEEGTIMLSEAIFAGSNPDSATAPLENLLKEHPNNYSALERLISLLRRAGKLDQVPALLAAAEAADRRSLAHAGYRYCSALYHRYTNDISKAILEFNLSRKDDTWGPHALAHMIELYLNPDQDGAWEERESGPLDETTSEHVRVAEKLLEELRPKAKDAQRFKVLENYYLLGTRNKTKIDQAMQSFMDMLDHDQDYLPAILGMSTGFMVEKNAHKARNLLKRVGKMEISSRDGEDFTKANLLLAKFYVDKEKNDLAQELCKKCLVQDRSCGQAWEILGLVMEKDLNYENASECYEKAWKLEFEASASVGFKLAWTYLKCKRYIDCIDICEKVLAQYPDYPRIREEILKKAQYSIRCVESK